MTVYCFFVRFRRRLPSIVVGAGRVKPRRAFHTVFALQCSAAVLYSHLALAHASSGPAKTGAFSKQSRVYLQPFFVAGQHPEEVFLNVADSRRAKHACTVSLWRKTIELAPSCTRFLVERVSCFVYFFLLCVQGVDVYSASKSQDLEFAQRSAGFSTTLTSHM